MEREQALNCLTEEAREDPCVLAVLVFGSAARGDAAPDSDVDVCLVLDPRVLLDAGEKRLEFLSRHDLDIHVFQQLPLYIRRRVLREGQVLLSKDDDVLYDLAIRTARAFEDYRHIYLGYLEAVERAGS